MHCYIISIPSAKERLERTKRELAMCCPDIAWSVPPMSVASEWSDVEFASYYDSDLAISRFHRDMSRGEVACALSHQSAMREFLKTADECALILEDDVMLSPVCGRFLSVAEKWLSFKRNRPVCIVLSEPHAVRCWWTPQWMPGLKRTRPIRVFGALAYIVNRAGASRVLAANPLPIAMFSDDWQYYRSQGLSLLGVHPFLAGSYDFERGDSSLVEGRRAAYESGMARRKKPTLMSIIILSVRGHAKLLWWRLSGVRSNGEMRSNESLYQRKGASDADAI